MFSRQRPFTQKTIAMIIIQYLGQDVKDYLKNFLYANKIGLPSLCPCCGEPSLIRWGYYCRQGFCKEGQIRIQRVRCKTCLKTSSILPSFLLPYKRVPLSILQNLILEYTCTEESLSGVWAQTPDAPACLTTLQRWITVLVQAISCWIPLIFREILSLNPSSPVTEMPSPPPHTQKDTLRSFLFLCQHLYAESKHISNGLIYEPDRLFEFISLWLWQKGGYHLMRT